jgi:hypothetical protein
MSLSSVEDVLGSARRLWSGRESIDLDLVDGEFYWRYCRGDLVQQLEELLPTLDDEASPVDRIAAVFDHLYAMEQEIPGLTSWIENREPPRMRDPLVSWHHPGSTVVPAFSGKMKPSGIGAWLCMGVRNSHWTGADVERACRHEAKVFASHLYNRNLLVNGESTADEMLVAVDFKFYGAGELTFTSDWWQIPSGDSRQVRVESSVTMCVIAHPFPPEGVLAAMYDSIVRDHYAWHQRLYGYQALGNQTVDVAIRTWAIGLLVGSGVKYRHAERAVAEALALAGILESSQFSVDRRNLTSRVPEAEPFLFSSTRPPKTL